MSGSELHMTHKLASAFQQAFRISNLGTSKEPNIHVSFECVDVCKRRVSHTRRRMAIMQYFAHIVPTFTHDLEPMLRDCAQFPRMRLHPVLDGWITLNRTEEPEELVHVGFGLQAQRWPRRR